MRTQPSKDADYIAFALNISAQCTANQGAWHLNEAMVTELQTLTDRANADYKVNSNRATANHQTVVNKNASFKALRTFMSIVIRSLIANLDVPNAELMAMGLPSREHHIHEPLPAPTEAPNISITLRHGEITAHIHRPSHGHPLEHAGRKRYHGFVLRYRKEDETEWHEKYTTRLHLTLTFDSADEGKHITLAAAWINPRLQHGPWSDELKALIN
ncbi:MAG: hypothetical protein LBQ28_02470 [Prevotellaceae bacterium]|jgi:hypothetical protein|nr:hypothetical protein [Prevotellaceae bacterium]